MNKKIVIIAIVVVALPVVAFAAPGLPHQFYGDATYTDGTAISSGNVVVKIGSTQVGSFPITGGKYGYNPNIVFVTDPDSNRAGSTLTFYIGTTDTSKTATFINGGYEKVNLSIAPVTTPTPTPTPPTGGGGGGGSSNPIASSTPNPTPTLSSTPAPKIPLTEEQKKVDANNDGMIDVQDFNTLMVNWGNSGGSGDFDGNGKVDVFDFNMLMVNWS